MDRLGSLGDALGALGVGERNQQRPELLADPFFDNAAAWTQGGTLFTVTGGVATDTLGVYNVDYLAQTFKTIPGYVYTVTLVVDSVSAGNTQVDITGIATPISGKASPGTYSGTFVATSTSHEVRLQGNGFTGTCSMLSIR